MEDRDLSWLAALEHNVDRAAEQLRALREDNERLAARLAELEAAEAAPQASGDDPAVGWRKERTAVRRRVEALAESLEALLAADR